MASDLVWTHASERDRDAIVEYLLGLAGGVGPASRFMDDLEGALRRICEYQELYAPSRDEHLARLGYRSCFFMRYVLLYKVLDDKVLVGRIFHAAQDYARLV